MYYSGLTIDNWVTDHITGSLNRNTSNDLDKVSLTLQITCCTFTHASNNVIVYVPTQSIG